MFKYLVSRNVKCPKHKIWLCILGHVLNTFIKLGLISNYTISLLAFTVDSQISLESETVFYDRKVSAFKRLNGYRKDSCPQELQWGKKQITWFSKEVLFCLSLLSSLLPPSFPQLQWNMQKPKMCTQAGWNAYGLTSLFLDNSLQNVKSLLTSVFMSALSDHKHPN